MAEELFWYNEKGRKPQEAVRDAAVVYRGKFGCTPNVCFCHAEVRNGTAEIDGIRLVAQARVSYPSYLFLSQEAGGVILTGGGQ